jgi:phage regulator Rha-like protein
MKGGPGSTPAIVAVMDVEDRIFTVREKKVMLDADLAELYGVETRRLNEQVKRNAERFPADFAFQLTQEEYTALRSQIATLKAGRGQHRKYLPFAFTEHGAIMAATVLNSERAVEMSVFVVRAFVKLRELLSTHKELARRLTEIENTLGKHDKAIKALIVAVKRLMVAPAALPAPAGKGKKKIGF